ncbi:MAG TPA: sugar transferase [Bryobacteraceae bacterium]|nr:sugar transferase [Bryobacteraceae bacterium]
MKTNLVKSMAARANVAPAVPAIAFPRLATTESQALKRAMDVVLGSLFLVLSFPLLLLAALAIRLESGGPVLFAHTRVGHGGRRFRLWKFRTMRTDGDAVLERHFEELPEARAEWESTHKLRHDPRVTRVGRWLRRTSIDELPQLWNVLRGEMSLAGPRPVVEAEKTHYGAAWPLYTLAVPGLTGLWQVSGRNDTSYRRRVALDAYYVRNWSLRLDIEVLLRTVRVVLLGKGAY